MAQETLMAAGSIYAARFQCARSLRAFLPERSGPGRAEPGSGSSNRVPTGTSKTFAKSSSVATVTFSEPRSIRPRYARSIPASSASRSCERPRATRNLRRFHPIASRAFMPAIGDDCGLTIDGLSVPDFLGYSLTLGVTMTEWYYEQDGAHKGPVSEADLNVMLADRLIDPNTRVWTASFGQQWKRALETQLQIPQPTTPPPLLPPPLGPVGWASAQPAAPVAPLPFGQPAAAPTLANVTEKWAMWLAFSPLILLAVDILLTSRGIDPYGDNKQAHGATFWFGVANLWLAYKDVEAIYAAGRNPLRRWLWPFIFLLPVCYLIRRWSVANTPLTSAWIWLLVMLVYLLGAAALSLQ